MSFLPVKHFPALCETHKASETAAFSEKCRSALSTCESGICMFFLFGCVRSLCHFSENWRRFLWAVGGPEEAQGLSDGMTSSLFDLESLAVIPVQPVASWQRSEMNRLDRWEENRANWRAWMGSGEARRSQTDRGGDLTQSQFNWRKTNQTGCCKEAWVRALLSVFVYVNAFLWECVCAHNTAVCKFYLKHRCCMYSTATTPFIEL